MTMRQTKKGNLCYYGMIIHIGVDMESGLIHSVVTTAAKVHDLTPAGELLRQTTGQRGNCFLIRTLISCCLEIP